MRPTLEAMSEMGIPLCVHGETDGFVMDREAEFMSIYELLAKNFPIQSFVSDNAQSIYGICPEFKEVTLEKRTFIVPEKYGSVVPMYAGEAIAWAIESVD